MTIHIEWSTIWHVAGGVGLVVLGIVIGVLWMASTVRLWS